MGYMITHEMAKNILEIMSDHCNACHAADGCMIDGCAPEEIINKFESLTGIKTKLSHRGDCEPLCKVCGSEPQEIDGRCFHCDRYKHK